MLIKEKNTWPVGTIISKDLEKYVLILKLINYTSHYKVEYLVLDIKKIL